MRTPRLGKEDQEKAIVKLRSCIDEVEEIAAACKLVYNECPDPRKKERGDAPLRLYLCEEVALRQLLALQASHDASFDQNKSYDPYRFSAAANILNPDSHVSQYSITLRATSKQVTDPDKVKLDVARERDININICYSNAENLIHSDPSMGEARARAIRQEARKEAEAIDAIAQKILHDMNLPEEERQLIVRISSSQRAYIYAYCDFAGQHALLREKVPNFLFFKPSNLRPNASFSLFLSKAKNVFGDVFVAQIEDL